jgi:hypothetical protein
MIRVNIGTHKHEEFTTLYTHTYILSDSAILVYKHSKTSEKHMHTSISKHANHWHHNLVIQAYIYSTTPGI